MTSSRDRTYQLYIAGRWVDSDGADELTVINPATGECVQQLGRHDDKEAVVT